MREEVTRDAVFRNSSFSRRIVVNIARLPELLHRENDD
jgi:hypothetical protein